MTNKGGGMSDMGKLDMLQWLSGSSYTSLAEIKQLIICRTGKVVSIYVLMQWLDDLWKENLVERNPASDELFPLQVSFRLAQQSLPHKK
jgi:hypothetical protein